MIGSAMGLSVEEAQAMRLDRIVALGGRSDALAGTSGSNNVNAFGLPENNTWQALEDGRSVWVLGLSERTGSLARAEPISWTAERGMIT
jgi:hypothetical protein